MNPSRTTDKYLLIPSPLLIALIAGWASHSFLGVAGHTSSIPKLFTKVRDGMYNVWWVLIQSGDNRPGISYT
jgi:hypothetical protein